MNLEDPPLWSRRTLRRLGEALVAGDPVPSECPQYDDVMLWHGDLAAEVARIVSTTPWSALNGGTLPATGRAKTRDTLVQKLAREQHLSLDQLQDLAGVRVDGDFTLNVQLALANEVAAHFGDRSVVKDIRSNPHSGYRAVHVWVRCPAGRVEIQFRTVEQSLWANTFERVADRIGRNIRYGELPNEPGAHRLVEHLHKVSDEIATFENSRQTIANYRQAIDALQTALDALTLPDEQRRLLIPIQEAMATAQASLVEAESTAARMRSTYVKSFDDVLASIDLMEEG